MATVNNLSTGKLIGTVKALIGTATATDANGVTRTLQIGDKVYENDIITASVAGGTIHIEFTNNSFATLASGQTLTLDKSVFAPVAEEQAPHVSEEALQAQIAAGLDPTLVAEAAAAGAAGGGGGADGGHQFVIVEQNAARGDVSPGFETRGHAAQSASAENNTGVGVRAESEAEPEKPEEGTTPIIPPAPEPPVYTYDARAVMYTADNPDGTHTLALTGVNVDSYSWKDPAGADYFDVDLSDDGLLTFTLKDGVSLPADFANLYNYIEVVSGGNTYTVQLIVNQDNQFDSLKENADTIHGAALAASGLIHGEWHEGKDLTTEGRVESSELADSVSFSGPVGNSTISTGQGDDRILVDAKTDSGNVTGLGTSSVDMGGGDNLAALKATTAAGDATGMADSTLVAGEGQNEVRIQAVSGTGVATGMTGSTITLGGSGNANIVNVTASSTDANKGVAYGLYASDNRNAITTDGTVNVTAMGGNANATTNDGKALTAAGLYAVSGGENKLDLGGTGSVTISAQGNSNMVAGLYATLGGTNTIANVKDVTIHTNVNVDADNKATASGSSLAYGMYAAGTGLNTSAVNASNRINASGSVEIMVGNAPGNTSNYYKNSYGMYGVSGGINEITGARDVNIYVNANKEGGLLAGNNPALTAASYGMYTYRAGSLDVTQGLNIIRDVGTIKIMVNSLTGQAHGLYSAGGRNEISNADKLQIHANVDSSGNMIDKSTISTDSFATGLSASTLTSNVPASNTIRDIGTVEIMVGSKTSSSYGLYATSPAINTIANVGQLIVHANVDKEGNIYQDAKGLQNVSALHALVMGQNVLSNIGSVELMAGSNAGPVMTVYSLTGGITRVNADADTTKDNTIRISAAGNNTTSKDATAVFADTSVSRYSGRLSGNYIGNEKTNLLEIKAEALNTGNAYGLYAIKQNNDLTDAALNVLTGQAVHIDALAKTGTAYGLYAKNTGIQAGADNKITATDVRIHANVNEDGVTPSRAGTAYGVAATGTGGAGNLINATGTVDIAAGSTANNAYGVSATSAPNFGANAGQTVTVTNNMVNAINADKGINILASGVQATGLQALISNTVTNNHQGILNIDGEARNTLYARTGDITVDANATTKEAYGLYAAATSAITSSTGTVNFNMIAKNELIADAGNVRVEASSISGPAYSLYANNGINTITVSGDTHLLAGTTSGSASGLYASTSGANVINAGGLVNVAAGSDTGAAYGLQALAGGTNTTNADSLIIRTNIDADGTIRQTAGTAFGLHATGSGSNIVEATNVEIRTGTSGTSTGHAQGMHVSGGINKVTADTVTIDIQSKTTGTAAVGGSATGMAADSGTNTIEVGKQLDIHAQSTGRYAYGLHAQSGTNIINAAENAKVTISAESNTGNAFGVYAPGGKTIITADQLEISATSAKGAAYGLGADNRGSNTIQGTGNVGIEVRITVTAGTAANALAMYAGTGSVNKITGSDYSDTISLKGNIKTGGSGQNIINTGGGSDTIAIEGTVSGLTLNAGVGGYDILILTAASLTEFNTRYEAWLKTNFSTMEIEKIEIVIKGSEGGGALDPSLNWLNNIATVTGADLELIRDPALPPVADSIEPAMVTMAAFADDGENPTPAAATTSETTESAVTSHVADSNLQPTEEAVADQNTIQSEQPQAEPLHTETTALDATAATLAGEAALETIQQSPHHILLADDITLPESVTYHSLVDAEGNIDLDAIHAVKTLLTSEAHHELHAGENGDILFGAAGDDILIGGSGDDILVSGTGQTTFVYEQGNLDHITSGDKILDFKLGEDVLDISDLLAGADKPGSATELVGNGFLNFDKITQNEDGTTTIKLSIDTDGSAGHEAGAVPLAEMTVYGLNLGSDSTANDVLEQLVNNGSIQF